MSIQNNTLTNLAYLEYGKFVGITGDTRFPALSVTRHDLSVPSASSVDTFNKYAVLVYDVSNTFTMTETRTSGVPSFISAQVYLANTTASPASPVLSLISSTSCQIFLNAYSTATLNLAVSSVLNYAGCSITFFA